MYLQEDMSMNQQFDFEGGDEDIRSRFEMYLLSLLASVKTSQTAAISVDPAIRGMFSHCAQGRNRSLSTVYRHRERFPG